MTGRMTQIPDGIIHERRQVSVGPTRELRTRKFVVRLFTAWCTVILPFAVQFLEGHMTVKPIVHEIRIQNQVIFLDPPIEYARQTWVKQLHDWIGRTEPVGCEVSAA